MQEKRKMILKDKNDKKRKQSIGLKVRKEIIILCGKDYVREYEIERKQKKRKRKHSFKKRNFNKEIINRNKYFS